MIKCLTCIAPCALQGAQTEAERAKAVAAAKEAAKLESQVGMPP